MKPLKHKIIDLPKLSTARKDEGKHGKHMQGIYRDLWRWTKEHWYDTARTYEANPGSVYNAWRYLNDHPIYWDLARWPSDDQDAEPDRHFRNLTHNMGMEHVEIGPHRVNPADRRISEDKALNTAMEWWAETGEVAWVAGPGPHRYHNPDLDCGAATYEDTVIKMAYRVWKHYGNDRRKCAPQYHEARQAKADARIKKSFGPRSGIAKTRPYGHRCGWERKPGVEGIIQDIEEREAARAK